MNRKKTYMVLLAACLFSIFLSIQVEAAELEFHNILMKPAIISGIEASFLFPHKEEPFSIEGKWKSIGKNGFGQAQPGAIVVFDGVHCNFFSPSDTYAFYEDGEKWRLDLTSMLFAQNLSLRVKVVDNDTIKVKYGKMTTKLKRVG